jgi:protein TonB
LAPVSTPAQKAVLSQEPQTVAEGILQGKAMIKVKPDYPPSARKMNALGTVEVRILISENGNVIEAKAISGHLALRRAAVDAAYKWVFRPTTANRVPVKVQGILTFVFAPSTK